MRKHLYALSFPILLSSLSIISIPTVIIIKSTSGCVNHTAFIPNPIGKKIITGTNKNNYLSITIVPAFFPFPIDWKNVIVITITPYKINTE